MTKMLPNKLLSLLILWMVIFLQCDNSSRSGENSQPSSNEDEMFNEVMRIHDEAMAKMGKLHQVKKSLEELKANLSGEEDLEKEVLMTIESIDSADESMFAWMAAFKDPRSLSDKNQVMRSLELELQRIRKVASDIDQSIQSGDSLILNVK